MQSDIYLHIYLHRFTKTRTIYTINLVIFKLKNMTKVISDPEKIDEILERGTIVEILPTKKEFREKLLSGQRLRFYIGFDATAPTLHLSHAKNIMLLEKFRKLGHEVILLFGDFTARIGDPSGESNARKQLSAEQVMENVNTWKKLVAPLMDFKAKNNPPLVKYNSEWLAKLKFEDVLKLASNLTVQQMLERDMFDKRLKEGKAIHMHEFMYPLMQGYDSVAMEVDVELCGTDQIFNALVGRTLLKKLKNKEKFVTAVTLMENPVTKELMSKSKGTGVFLDSSPQDMYGQIMSQADEMIKVLLVNCTSFSKEEIKEMLALPNPRDAKMKLALEITKTFHGEKTALEAAEYFNKTIVKKDIPDKLDEISKKADIYNLVDLLLELEMVSSKNEARRLIKEGAIKIDQKAITEIDYELNLKSNVVLQRGKKIFKKIIAK
jgi:tyrosyl-tRNA synthetase